MSLDKNLQVLYHVIQTRRAAIFKIVELKALGTKFGWKVLNVEYICLGMKRAEQDLLERGEGNESQEKEPVVDQQAVGVEHEFDREFWIKVSNL